MKLGYYKINYENVANNQSGEDARVLKSLVKDNLICLGPEFAGKLLVSKTLLKRGHIREECVSYVHDKCNTIELSAALKAFPITPNDIITLNGTPYGVNIHKIKKIDLENNSFTFNLVINELINGFSINDVEIKVTPERDLITEIKNYFGGAEIQIIKNQINTITCAVLYDCNTHTFINGGNCTKVVYLRYKNAYCTADNYQDAIPEDKVFNDNFFMEVFHMIMKAKSPFTATKVKCITNKTKREFKLTIGKEYDVLKTYIADEDGKTKVTITNDLKLQKSYDLKLFTYEENN